MTYNVFGGTLNLIQLKSTLQTVCSVLFSFGVNVGTEINVTAHSQRRSSAYVLPKLGRVPLNDEN